MCACHVIYLCIYQSWSPHRPHTDSILTLEQRGGGREQGVTRRRAGMRSRVEGRDPSKTFSNASKHSSLEQKQKLCVHVCQRIHTKGHSIQTLVLEPVAK